MSFLYKIFWKGLITVLPVSLTFYILVWAIKGIDGILGQNLKVILPEFLYFPGIGILGSFVIICLVGLILNNFVAGKFFSYLEEQLEKLPFVKTIYGPLKDLMGLFATNANQNMKRVVLVQMPNDIHLLGLVTREHFYDISQNSIADEKVAVFIPGSYIMGGLTIIVNKSSLKELDIPVDKAMKLAITGWIQTDKNKSFK